MGVLGGAHTETAAVEGVEGTYGGRSYTRGASKGWVEVQVCTIEEQQLTRRRSVGWSVSAVRLEALMHG